MIPRNEAMQILQKYGRNAGWTRHCEAVAGFSSIACAALEGYYEIDSKFLWSAALLKVSNRWGTASGRMATI
ncbi:MAG: hypothetical protein ACOWWM_19750 [Desulfobacterales bacterium]